MRIGLFVYKRASAVVYLLVYVDDIILTGNSNQLIKQLIHQMDSVFSLKQLGALDYFLGIEVKTLSNGSLLLTQGKYIRDLLSKTNMLEAKSLPTPMITSCNLNKTGSNPVADATLYKSVVGALQYATITCPDITFTSEW